MEMSQSDRGYSRMKKNKHLMDILNLSTADPCFNLAVEEILLKKRSGEYLIIYINSPSVIIGKHQVAHMEADTEFITKNSIPVIRRISGGGTVYHDQGNLNFTFILKSKKGGQVDFRKYTRPVIDFLAFVGVDAIFGGKNDLLVNGIKISGNAEHIFGERVLHHGTILFDADIATLKESLRKDTSCYNTRAVRSNPSPVMNLKELLTGIKDINDFREKIYCYFINRPENYDIKLTDDEISEAESLAISKFRTWEWNYAYGPEYFFNNRFIFSKVEYSVRMYVKDGIIKECELKGQGLIQKHGKNLVGCRHMPEDIRIVFSRNNMPESIFFHFF